MRYSLVRAATASHSPEFITYLLECSLECAESTQSLDSSKSPESLYFPKSYKSLAIPDFLNPLDCKSPTSTRPALIPLQQEDEEFPNLAETVILKDTWTFISKQVAVPPPAPDIAPAPSIGPPDSTAQNRLQLHLTFLFFFNETKELQFNMASTEMEKARKKNTDNTLSVKNLHTKYVQKMLKIV